MLQRFSTFPLGARSETLSGLIERFGQWWLREFLNLFPEQTAEWLMRRGRKVLMVVPEHDCASLQLLGGTRQEIGSSRVGPDERVASAIDSFLSLHGLKRKDVDIGIRLPSEKFFERSIALPLEAADSLGDAVLQDLKAKTPFRVEDIYHGYAASMTAKKSKIHVRQWVIRKDFVADVLAQLGLDLDDLTFIEHSDETGSNALATRIAIRPNRDDGRTLWARKAVWMLVVGTVLLAAASAASTYWCQQALIDELALQVAASRSKAQKVRSELDKLEQRQSALFRLRRQRTASPTLLGIWDEVTRVLPTHSWLTELRVSEIPPKQDRQITMTGFSAAASSLIGLIAQSPMFFDASPTAPIAVDPVEGRERFVLQAKIRQSKPDGKAP